jgi:dGTPase
MFEEIYERLLHDLKNDIKSSPVFKHHIEFVNNANRFNGFEYTKNSDFNDIVTDYIASMTDDYFIDLYQYLFEKDAPIKYISYFENV